MTDLLTRLHNASEGSRELDCDIQEMDYRTGELDRSRYSNDQGPFFLNKFNTNWFEIPHYTTSIDAALTLVPETHRFVALVSHVQATKDYRIVEVSNWQARLVPVERHKPPGMIIGEHPSNRVFALCDAALQAQQSKAEVA